MTVQVRHHHVATAVVEDGVLAAAGEQKLEPVEGSVVVRAVAHTRPEVEAALVLDDCEHVKYTR